MEALTIISQLYMWILVILLFLGLGLGILGFINFVTDKLQPKTLHPASKSFKKEEARSIDGKQPELIRTDSIDGNWLRFAAFSFLGLLVIVTIIGLFSMSNKPQIPQIANQHSSHSAIGNSPDPYGMMGHNPMAGSPDAYGNYPHANTNGYTSGSYDINGNPYWNNMQNFSGSYSSSMNPW